MITFDVGNTEKASQIASRAQIALNEGDTARAQCLFREAAEELERQISGVRKQSDKQMLRFLAASQYYHGGLYTDAQRLCRRVEVRLLPTEVRPTFQQYFRDVNERADPGYKGKIREVLLKYHLAKDAQGILSLLQDHPYVLTSAGLAFIRAASCEKIKDYRAAARFSADVIRYSVETPDLLFTTLGLPIALTSEGNFDEAWEYVSYQLKAIPHAFTSINASLVRFHQAIRAVSNEERIALSGEQLRFFESGLRRFQLLPSTIREHLKICEYMALAFDAAAIGYLRLDQPDAARKLCNRIVDLFPNMPVSSALRDIANLSSFQTVEEAANEKFRDRERAIFSNFDRRRQETVKEIFFVAA